jgi:CBS domain-containing protein
MSQERVHRLPVVNSDGGLVGILSINDLVLHAEEGVGKKPEISYEDAVQAFKAICAHPASTIRAVAG